MKLHEESSIFEEAIRATANHKGLPVSYIEKDYWVTSALKELATSAVADEVVFKGGTSLSKAYNLISRFSEDIDIAILTEGLSTNQSARKVKKACKVVAAIYEEIESDDTSKNSSFRKVRFAYPRIDDSVVEGQITDSILLEVNAFADPEPYKYMPISSYIADFLKKTGQDSAVDQYELHTFDMKVLCTTRTLCEKVMGLVKAGHGTDGIENLKKKIRHIYDIHFLLSDPVTSKFVESVEFQEMISKVIFCDQQAFPSTPWFDAPLSSACLFSDFEEVWASIEGIYNSDFKAMVVDKDLPTKEMLGETISIIHKQLTVYDLG